MLELAHSITIRQAQIDDCPFIARAVLEAVDFQNITPAVIEKQIAACQRTDVLFSWTNTFVACKNGQVVASLTAYDGRYYQTMRSVTFPLIYQMHGVDLHTQADETTAGEYYLDSLFVLPEFREQGIGTALLQYGITYAKKIRSPRATLLVKSDNWAAKKLYQSVGFQYERQLFAFQAMYDKMQQSFSYAPLLEVCASSVSSARNANAACAPRIELCQNLAIGGVTPDRTDIRTCVQELSLQTFVLIRPRGGDFCYSEAEFQQILDDIRYCKTIGAAGVVIGFLRPDGTVDEEQCRRAVAEARPLSITFHRAFDRCANWQIALEQIIALGFNRILTSGQQPTAEQGAEILRQMVQQANNRITLLAGSGINAHNAQRILQITGVTEIHGSCKTTDFQSDIIEIEKILTLIKE